MLLLAALVWLTMAGPLPARSRSGACRRAALAGRLGRPALLLIRHRSRRSPDACRSDHPGHRLWELRSSGATGLPNCSRPFGRQRSHDRRRQNIGRRRCTAIRNELGEVLVIGSLATDFSSIRRIAIGRVEQGRGSRTRSRSMRPAGRSPRCAHAKRCAAAMGRRSGRVAAASDSRHRGSAAFP